MKTQSHHSMQQSPAKRKWKAVAAVVSCLVLLLSCLLMRAAFSDEGNKGNASPGYAGSESCKGCHEDHTRSYENTYHSKKSDARTPGATHECESCHGPGSAHVEAGGGKGTGGMVTYKEKGSEGTEKINDTCLQCHDRRKLQHFKGSVHEERGLSCSSCHSLHGGFEKNLKTEKQEELCGECHKGVKADMLKSSHHPVREGKMDCSSCHNPHGSTGPKNITANTVNELCYKCHTEKRGPFLWEHGPVVEECNNCHKAHGSNHRKLLVQKPPYLCQSCHVISSGHVSFLALAQGQGSVYTNAGPSATANPGSRLVGRSCCNCHSLVHGSNHPSGKYFVR